MKICDYCGSENDSNNTYCVNCGEPIKNDSYSEFCNSYEMQTNASPNIDDTLPDNQIKNESKEYESIPCSASDSTSYKNATACNTTEYYALHNTNYFVHLMSCLYSSKLIAISILSIIMLCLLAAFNTYLSIYFILIIISSLCIYFSAKNKFSSFIGLNPILTVKIIRFIIYFLAFIFIFLLRYIDMPNIYEQISYYYSSFNFNPFIMNNKDLPLLLEAFAYIFMVLIILPSIIMDAIDTVTIVSLKNNILKCKFKENSDSICIVLFTGASSVIRLIKGIAFAFIGLILTAFIIYEHAAISIALTPHLDYIELGIFSFGLPLTKSMTTTAITFLLLPLIFFVRSAIEFLIRNIIKNIQSFNYCNR